MPESARTESSTHTIKPATAWWFTVGIHAGLLFLAVLVVWATVGRDRAGSASASITGTTAKQAAPAAEPLTTEVTTVAEPQPEAAPEESPSPAPAVVSESPEPTGIEVPASVDRTPPMIKLLDEGESWPPTMTRPDAPDPFAEHGQLYGVPGAYRVVYLIDASGSLIDTLPFVQMELQETLRSLRPQQSFAVMFFNGDRVIEAPPVGMKRAATDAVTITNQWIDPGSGKIIASGRPGASAAIRRALAYQPDAIVLVSDGLTGRGDEALARRAKLLTLISAANTHDTVFHTLQIRQPDPLSSVNRRGTLEQIAVQTGGVHRYVSDADLSRD